MQSQCIYPPNNDIRFLGGIYLAHLGTILVNGFEKGPCWVNFIKINPTGVDVGTRRAKIYKIYHAGIDVGTGRAKLYQTAQFRPTRTPYGL